MWAAQLSAADRVLVILIENGGVDLGIPELVNKLLAFLPGSGLIPDSVKQRLVAHLREKIKSFTDNLMETLELSINRYQKSKPDLFGDVVVLRDGTSSYQALKGQLIALSTAGKIIDLFILTHGSGDFISVPGGIDSQKIRQMKTEHGKPLKIRSVYMMNCVGSSLNQAWIDAGAKASSGSIRNNYLPEPTMFFFWKNWKEGQSFENAATSAYRKTINLMNDTVRGFLRSLPIPGTGMLADKVDFEKMDFVRDSAPVIQGQRSVTISTDNLTFTQSISSMLATTVLPVDVLKDLGSAQPAVNGNGRPHAVSPQGAEFIKKQENFRATLAADLAGQCAIGYGTVLHAGRCDGHPTEQPYAAGISEQDAARLLEQRTAELQQMVAQVVKVPLNQNQNDALVSFVYSIGMDGFEKSTLLRLLNESNYAAVPVEMKKWIKARQNGQVGDVPELAKRRDAEAQLFQKPVSAVAQSIAFSGIDYTIPGILPLITQPSPMTCWAAVMTMMYSWRNSVSIQIRDALARIGPQYVTMFDNGQGLDRDTAKVLYQDAGLVAIYSFNPTVDGWASLLRKYGPLYVDVGYNTNPNTHAIIVKGVSGDGSPDGTSMTYVDPVDGRTVTLRFRDFLAKYEAQSAVQWPYTIVHWPPSTSTQSSLPITHSYKFQSASQVVTEMSAYSYAQNPGVVIAGISVADAAQIGLAGIAIAQAQVQASQGSFTLVYDKAQRLLTTEARAQMPGSQRTKRSYSRPLLWLAIARLNAAKADVIIEWEGNPYGEIGTPIIRRNLTTSTEWSKSSANITITKVDRIPLPGTDPRTWPIVYTYEGTYDPWGNGYFEFSGEFEINAFGGLKFNRHQVVSRSTADWALGGTPEGKVAKGDDVVVAVPEIPQEQINYLKSRLP